MYVFSKFINVEVTWKQRVETYPLAVKTATNTNQETELPSFTKARGVLFKLGPFPPFTTSFFYFFSSSLVPLSLFSLSEFRIYRSVICVGSNKETLYYCTAFKVEAFPEKEHSLFSLYSVYFLDESRGGKVFLFFFSSIFSRFYFYMKYEGAGAKQKMYR